MSRILYNKRDEGVTVITNTYVRKRGVDKMCELMQKLADQAKHDNSVEIAERLLYRGTSIDDVAYSTALPRDEVEAIAERLGKQTA